HCARETECVRERARETEERVTLRERDRVCLRERTKGMGSQTNQKWDDTAGVYRARAALTCHLRGSMVRAARPIRQRSADVFPSDTQWAARREQSSPALR
ncbi:hypothetical protein PO909_018982, partial [Leuciscus waleckii]